MKSHEELNTLKAEVENMNKKLAELTEDELTQVTGGNWEDLYKQGNENLYHDLAVAEYFGNFYNKLMDEGKEAARAYYNSIKSELYDQDKALFQEVFSQTGESL